MTATISMTTSSTWIRPSATTDVDEVVYDAGYSPPEKPLG
jgi:hypothetical protein